jgi:hypothetical protein
MDSNPVDAYDEVIEEVTGICPNVETDWLVSPVFEDRFDHQWICPACEGPLAEDRAEAIEVFKDQTMDKDEIVGDYRE